IYESKACKQYRRAAQYFERAYQWNPNTQYDARLRAARLYDRQLMERGKAMELYREVSAHETDPKRLQEAQKPLAEMPACRRFRNSHPSNPSSQFRYNGPPFPPFD